MATLKLNDVSVRVTLELITPDDAVRWLLGHKNRQVKNRRVRDYARDMRDRKWKFNGEPLIFTDDGQLLDGQHRLLAIMETNTSHTMLVVRGVDRDAFSTIDAGLSRQPLDHLHVAGYDCAALMAASLRVVDDVRSGELTTVNRNKAYGTRVLDAAEEYVGMHECCVFAVRLNKSVRLVPESIIAGLKWIFDRIDPDLSERFWSAVLSGNHIEGLPSCGLLRNRLIGNKSATTKLTRGQVAILVVLAWNACRQGRTNPALRIMSNELPTIHGFSQEIFHHGK